MIKQSPAKTKSFLKAINKAAMQKCNEISRQIEQTAKQEMQRAEEEASRDGHARIEAAQAKIQAQAQMEAATYKKAKKAEIYKKRSDYQKEIFSLAADELRAFTKTEAYRSFLLESLKSVPASEGKHIIFYLAEGDALAKEVLRERFPESPVQNDASIKIGGIKYRNNARAIMADDTLDARLDAQLDWFLSNSALKVE